MCLILAMTMTVSPMTAYAGTGISSFTGTTYNHNENFDNAIIVNGVDVSAHQGSIDWAKAKADGVDFAIIRIGYRGYGSAGNMAEDSWFVRNIEAAKAAGVMVGIYFYSQALNTLEARAEAKYTLKLLGDYELDLPIFMDYEFSPVSSGRFTSGTISKITATANVRAFCEYIEENGYEAGLYANLNFLNKTVDGKSLGEEYPIWVAQYYSTCNYKNDYTYWQYSSSGSVNGISTRADVNFWYLDRNAESTSSTSLADASVTVNASSYTYSAGTAYTPSVTVYHNGVQLMEGVDYKVRYIKNAQAGTAYAVVMGMGNYTDYKLASFTIKPTSDLSGITIKQPKDRKYTGSVTKPSYITVTDATGSKLIENLDYTYTVANAVNIGKADLIVNFCGNYTGSKTVKYNIVKATQSITVTDSRTTLKMSEGSYSLGASAKYDGASLSYSSSDKSVATVSSSGKVTAKGAGTATITISAAATDNYGTASKTISLTVENDIPDVVEPEEPDDPDEPTAEEVKNAKITAAVEATKVVSLKAPIVKKKKVKLTWNKSKSNYRLDYYEVWRSTKKSSGYVKLIATSNATSKYYINTKGLKAGTTYWYKVRGARVVDGKIVYTPFTKICVTTAK